MSLQVAEAMLHRGCDKLLIQLVVAGAEGDIHHRTAVLLDRGFVEVCGIQVIVQHGSLLHVALLHVLQAADIIQDPLQHQVADIDRIGRRCVDHGILVSLRGEIPDLRAQIALVSQKILTDDNDREACRSHILLSSAVDDAILGNIHRLRQDAG